MAIFLKFDGIDGDATHDKHKKWITIESLEWGVGRSVATQVGSGKNREASQPSVSEVSLNKQMDTASALLFQESCVGNKGKSATVHLVSTGSPGETYLEYTLSDALVTGYSVSTDGERPLESITLNFSKVEMKYIPLKENNEAGGPMIKSFDLVTAKAG